MAIFYKKVSLIPEAKKMLTEAYSMNSLSPDEILKVAQSKAETLEKATKGKFNWLKIGLAFVLVIFILILAYLSGQKAELINLYTILLHAGEISLGGLFGILLGEASK